MKIFKWLLSSTLGYICVGSEGLAFVCLAFFLTGTSPSPATFQVFFFLATLVLYIYHKYVRDEGWF